MDRKPHLRVKIKSLAEESRIIRNEVERVARRVRHARADDEAEGLQLLRESLTLHRTGTVRSAARHALLAYAILRDRPYSTLESRCHVPPRLNTVAKEAQRFGATHEEIMTWVTDARQHILSQGHPKRTVSDCHMCN